MGAVAPGGVNQNSALRATTASWASTRVDGAASPMAAATDAQRASMMAATPARTAATAATVAAAAGGHLANASRTSHSSRL